jgi:NAD(P)-dependent dehydrogenase (short-subunit alcohol dehydrogenase family)
MARVFVSGSADGLGKMAAELLIEQGHKVVLHARSAQRLPGDRRSRCGWTNLPRGILGLGAQGPSRRRQRRPDEEATARGDPAPRAAGLLPALRADRRNPDR